MSHYDDQREKEKELAAKELELIKSRQYTKKLNEGKS